MNPIDRLAARVDRLETIATLAAQVRAAQVRYFRERSPVVLLEAKRLEQLLDDALAKLGESEGGNP